MIMLDSYYVRLGKYQQSYKKHHTVANRPTPSHFLIVIGFVVLKGAATCGNLTGPLRDVYGTIGGLLQEFIAIREGWCLTQGIDNGPRGLLSSS